MCGPKWNLVSPIFTFQRYASDPEDLTKMFDVANEFFTSLGLEDMSEAYGPKAMISRPKNRDVDCHAS